MIYFVYRCYDIPMDIHLYSLWYPSKYITYVEMLIPGDDGRKVPRTPRRAATGNHGVNSRISSKLSWTLAQGNLDWFFDFPGGKSRNTSDSSDSCENSTSVNPTASQWAVPEARGAALSRQWKQGPTWGRWAGDGIWMTWSNSSWSYYLVRVYNSIII